ncbi:hypothetical protein CXF67_13385 [Psychroflexus sp. MES1-P1E]|nr:hypothetical protein CXF67_13385 [Psychroflexus sp. MES1-P1E]
MNGMVTLAIVFHCINLIPYTVFFKKEGIRTVATDSSICFSFMTNNPDYEKLLNKIETYRPDVLIPLENDTIAR